MKSTKCVECGFVGWSDVENCKACGALLGQRSHNLPSATPHNYGNDDQWGPSEGQKKGLAIFALVLGIISFFTFGLLGIGAITGIILACVSMGRVKREPWKYGGRGIAIAGLVLSTTSLVTVVPVGIIAAIAIPNLLASRRAANEASALYSLRQIASAQMVYHSNFDKYATLEELAAQNLIDPRLATGTKNGYNFTMELTTDETNLAGFAVVTVPATYRSSGTRSFYIDESAVIRGSDKYGGPSSKMDQPLEAETEFSNRSNRRVDYSRQPVY
jgi:type IV pilus assembly protein PilA